MNCYYWLLLLPISLLINDLAKYDGPKEIAMPEMEKTGKQFAEISEQFMQLRTENEKWKDQFAEILRRLKYKDDLQNQKNMEVIESITELKMAVNILKENTYWKYIAGLVDAPHWQSFIAGLLASLLIYLLSKKIYQNLYRN